MERQARGAHPFPSLLMIILDAYCFLFMRLPQLTLIAPLESIPSSNFRNSIYPLCITRLKLIACEFDAVERKENLSASLG